MRIERVTKYRCNGCGEEEQNPSGWITFRPLMVGQMTATFGGNIAGEDYCRSCVEKMRFAVAKSDPVRIA